MPSTLMEGITEDYYHQDNIRYGILLVCEEEVGWKIGAVSFLFESYVMSVELLNISLVSY